MCTSETYYSMGILYRLNNEYEKSLEALHSAINTRSEGAAIQWDNAVYITDVKASLGFTKLLMGDIQVGICRMPSVKLYL